MSGFEINARKAPRLREYGLGWGVANARLLYASDLHLRARSTHVVEQLLALVARARPDLVVLGGDLADTPGGLAPLRHLVRSMPRVAALAGNHDRYLGLARVREAVTGAGGHWLPDAMLRLAGLRVSAGEDADILCAHEPVEPARHRLVLAGHLHGSQCVMAERGGRLYPGAWFFRWNGDEFRMGERRLLVSRGMNDTVPVRWNCPRDVIVCDFA